MTSAECSAPKPGMAMPTSGKEVCRSTHGRRPGVVVTGMAVIAPCGVDLDTFAANLIEGRSGVRHYQTEWDRDAPHAAGVVANFDEHRFGLDARAIAGLDRYAQFGLAAAQAAIADARLAGVAAADIGVCVSTAIGGTPLMERRYGELTDRGRAPLRMQVTHGSDLYEASMFNSLCSRIGALVHAEGPCVCVSTGCTGGIDALGYAMDTILASRQAFHSDGSVASIPPV